MDERARGLIVALTVVTLVALGVSFVSGSKARRGNQQRAGLQSQIEKLTQANKALEESLKEREEKYAQETVMTKNLKEALVQEQLKNQVLTEELQRLEKKSSRDTSAASHAKIATTNITPASKTR